MPQAVMLTLNEVRARVARIKDKQGDPEAAHSLEDDLFEDVLRAVAVGHPDAMPMAQIALKTRTFDFPRWCA